MANEARGWRELGGTAAPLTRSEHDILAASARGASVRQVAGELGLPEGEVRAHLASAIRKLGARSRLEAVLIALRLGVIDP
jgi:DNA-binding NarL/FixJ family response regulator